MRKTQQSNLNLEYQISGHQYQCFYVSDFGNLSVQASISESNVFVLANSKTVDDQCKKGFTYEIENPHPMYLTSFLVIMARIKIEVTPASRLWMTKLTIRMSSL